jgi:rhodanese-related sulfurtransferase
MNDITTEQLKAKIDKNEDMVIVEVLGSDYYEDYHLPGAINIPFKDSDFAAEVEKQLPDKDKLIIVYCANSHCPVSGDAYKKLEQMGYTNIYDYDEGKEAWKEAGYPTE